MKQFFAIRSIELRSLLRARAPASPPTKDIREFLSLGGNTLKAFFRNRSLREITTPDVERFKLSLIGKITKRKTPRKGATVNRYVSLLSRVFLRAQLEGLVEFNPCQRIEKEPEGGRERYLTPAERPRLMATLINDLAFLRAPIEMSLGAGLRKRSELLKLRIENINFSALPIFRSAGGVEVEVLPNWLLLVATNHCGNSNQQKFAPTSLKAETAVKRAVR